MVGLLILLKASCEPSVPVPVLPVECSKGTKLVASPPVEDRPLAWTFPSDAILGLSEVWPFPGGEPTTTWWCMTAEGKPAGPVLTLGPDPFWIRGLVGEGGLWDGPMEGGYDFHRPERKAFSGTFSGGERTGTWTFFGPDGARVAQGSFAQGRPHGTWVVEGKRSRIEARYVYGKMHGGFKEIFPDGTEVHGHYFNGSRNYEWEFLAPDPATGIKQIVKEEVWKYGTFVLSWDPRTEPNPIPDQPIPFARLGPNAEGMCEVHARCASNAYFTTLLAGGAMTPEKALDTPLLVDYGDPSAVLSSADRRVLVDSYMLGAVEVSADETHAHASVTFDTKCVVGKPGEPIEVLSAPETVEYDLVYEDEVWKLVRPLPRAYVRLDVYLREYENTDPDWVERVLQTCRGEASRPR